MTRGAPSDRGAHATEIKPALGGLKGPLMKVAQMMATIPDALPSEYAAELAQLRSMAPPMGRPFVRRRMAAEEDGTLRTLPEVLAAPVPDDVREQVSWTAIVGPSIAGEVAVRRPTVGLFAGEDGTAAEQVALRARTEP